MDCGVIILLIFLVFVLPELLRFSATLKFIGGYLLILIAIGILHLFFFGIAGIGDFIGRHYGPETAENTADYAIVIFFILFFMLIIDSALEFKGIRALHRKIIRKGMTP